MELRALSRADAERFRKLRREGLLESPRSFGESVAEADALPLESIAQRLESDLKENFVIGAFAENAELIGMAGFARNPRLKGRHKGLIWGVYVQPAFRGKAVGRAILLEIIRRAKTLDGLDQIHLNVAVDTAAQRLYASLGFEVYGRERHSLKIEGEFVDEDLMTLFVR
jgi:RimJ/RimL family protein N-acetyltransferase